MDTKDKELCEEIYNKYYKSILRYVSKHVMDIHEAEDLTADIFLRCYEKIGTYDSQKASLSTWLFVITNNYLKNYYRDKKHNVSYESLLTEGFDVGKDEIDYAMNIEFLRSEITHALINLSETQRKAVIWKYFYNLSNSEIAFQLKTTEGNVRVILFRALKKLEEKIKV